MRSSARDAAARAIAFYDRGLARIEDRWAGGGETGDRFRDPTHLYAADLDLFGPASLFELLSIARTRAGEDTLAGWLHTEALVAWAEAPPLLGSAWLRPAAIALTVAAVATATVWLSTGNSTPFLVVLFAEIAFSWPLRERVLKALHGADGAARDLDVLAVVLSRLERETFTAARLTALQSRLTHGSRDIHRLHWFVELHEWQHNAIFAVLAAPLLWGTHLALAIEAWRRAHGRHVGEWLRISGEFEALASLSAYRYEHPG